MAGRDSIFINPFEVGAIGPDLFRAARNVGLEGLVSKRRSDGPYRGGRLPDWVKVRNRQHHAFDWREEGVHLVGQCIFVA